MTNFSVFMTNQMTSAIECATLKPAKQIAVCIGAQVQIVINYFLSIKEDFIMTNTKKRSRFFAVALVAVLMLVLAAPGFAIESSDISYDTSHGRQLGCDAVGSYVLNQFITGSIPYSGAPVSTWKDTRHVTQFWEFASLSRGGHLIIPLNEGTLSMNIGWSESTPQVNLFSIKDNGYYDAAITYEAESFSERYVSRLYSITPSTSYGKRYMCITSENTPVSDKNNTSKVVRWFYSGSRFYDIDNRTPTL